MKIYKIKKNSEQYESYMKCFTWGNKWTECNDKIKELLGVELEGNIYYNPRKLTMQKVPEHLTKEFCKPYFQNGNEKVYEAKKNSKINKQWIQLCEENKLPEPTTLSHLAFIYNLYNYSGNDYGQYALQKIEDDLYLEVSQRGSDWAKIEWVEEVPTSVYLRLKADLLEKKGA